MVEVEVEVVVEVGLIGLLHGKQREVVEAVKEPWKMLKGEEEVVVVPETT